MTAQQAFARAATVLRCAVRAGLVMARLAITRLESTRLPLAWPDRALLTMAGLALAGVITMTGEVTAAPRSPSPSAVAWRHYGLLGLPLWLSTDARGDTQCLSDDGVECLWGANRDTAPTPGPALRTVRCGPQHLRLHRRTGYERADSWCRAPLILRAWQDVSTGPPRIFQDGELTTLWRGMPLPRWTAADQPMWVVRGVLSERGELGLHIDVTVRDRGLARSGRLSLTVRAGAGTSAEAGPDGFRMTGLATIAPGPVTLAILMDPQGQVHFHQAEGWVDDILSPRHEVGQAPMAPPPTDARGRPLTVSDGPLWPIVGGRGGPLGGGEAQVKLSYPADNAGLLDLAALAAAAAKPADAASSPAQAPVAAAWTPPRAMIDDALFAIRRAVPR